MSMHDADAQKQIHQMVNFILNEARDKAQEIEAKAIEDFNIEKLRLVQQMKTKVRKEYQQKAKQMETERAIARSTAINKARLRKITARQVAVDRVVANATEELSKLSKNAEQYKALCIDLITQGLIMLLEDTVYVQCRKEDEKIIRDCLDAAAKKYTSILQSEAGVKRTVTIAIDEQNFLKPGPTANNNSPMNTCIGGVKITSKDRRIVADNTLDARVKLVVQNCLPAIRHTLFPVQ